MSMQIERLETECNDIKTNCEMQDSIIYERDGRVNDLLEKLYEKEKEMEKHRNMANKLTTQVIMNKSRTLHQS